MRAAGLLLLPIALWSASPVGAWRVPRHRPLWSDSALHSTCDRNIISDEHRGGRVVLDELLGQPAPREPAVLACNARVGANGIPLEGPQVQLCQAPRT